MGMSGGGWGREEHRAKPDECQQLEGTEGTDVSRGEERGLISLRRTWTCLETVEQSSGFSPSTYMAKLTLLELILTLVWSRRPQEGRGLVHMGDQAKNRFLGFGQREAAWWWGRPGGNQDMGLQG
jgi:hypothetical protein